MYDFAPVGYFTFDKNGLIIEVNLTAANKLGVERSFLIKKPFSLFISMGSKDVFYLHLRHVFRTGARQTCELKLVDKKGISVRYTIGKHISEGWRGEFQPLPGSHNRYY